MVFHLISTETEAIVAGRRQTKDNTTSPKSGSKEAADTDQQDSSTVPAHTNTKSVHPRDGHASDTQPTCPDPSGPSNTQVDDGISGLLSKLTFSDIKHGDSPIAGNTCNHETIETQSRATEISTDGAASEVSVATSEPKQAVGKGRGTRKRNKAKGGAKMVEGAVGPKVKTPSQEVKKVAVVFKLSMENCVFFHVSLLSWFKGHP